MDNNTNKNNLKIFFIKLFSISLAIVIIVNLIFNLLLAERLSKIDEIISLLDNQNRVEVKNKIRNELEKGLKKDEMIDKEDKEILIRVYKKVKEEFKDIEK